MRRKRKLLQKALAKIHSPCYNINLFGGVAHLGERDIRIVEVTGSSPAVSTIQKALKPCGFGAFFFYGERDAFCGSSNTFSNTFTINILQSSKRCSFFSMYQGAHICSSWFLYPRVRAILVYLSDYVRC